jgi:GT2 family glycosyltransferase
MSDLVRGKATICVVNYKTLDLTRVCLRSIRKYTGFPHEVLVVDNDSRDASLDYLKGLSWIRLVERRPEAPDPSGAWAHGAALDLGLSLCQTEFFVALHSDAIVHQGGWLDYLVGCLGSDSAVACCGADKIEVKPLWRVLLKKVSDVKALQRWLLADPVVRRWYQPFVRTVCAVYRTEVLRREGLSFQEDPITRFTVGQKLYYDLKERGYRTIMLSDRLASTYVLHLAHATQMLNPGEFGFEKVARKWRRIMGPWLASESFQDLLRNDRLDR